VSESRTARVIRQRLAAGEPVEELAKDWRAEAEEHLEDVRSAPTLDYACACEVCQLHERILLLLDVLEGEEGG
jgi:hypothetical protein